MKLSLVLVAALSLLAGCGKKSQEISTASANGTWKIRCMNISGKPQSIALNNLGQSLSTLTIDTYTDGSCTTVASELTYNLTRVQDSKRTANNAFEHNLEVVDVILVPRTPAAVADIVTDMRKRDARFDATTVAVGKVMNVTNKGPLYLAKKTLCEQSFQEFQANGETYRTDLSRITCSQSLTENSRQLIASFEKFSRSN